MSEQGAYVWEPLRKAPPKKKEPKSRQIIDVEAFKRLHKRGYDARPKDER